MKIALKSIAVLLLWMAVTALFAAYLSFTPKLLSVIPRDFSTIGSDPQLKMFVEIFALLLASMLWTATFGGAIIATQKIFEE